MLFNISAKLSYFLSDFKLYIFLLIFSFALLIYFVLKIYKSNTSDFSKKIKMAACFALFFLIIIFSFFEGYFRYIYDESDGLGFLKTHLKWMERHVVFNSDFYRDRNFEMGKEPGTFRIGVVGDSLTMGYGINDVENRFSNILEKKLKDEGYNAEVFNLGVAGLDTCSEITQLTRTRDLNIDLFVWEYYPNDIQPCGVSSGSRIIESEYAHFNPIISSVRDQSFLFDFVYWRFSGIHSDVLARLGKADMAQFSNEDVFTEHTLAIATLSAILKGEEEKEREVIVIIFPFIHLLGDEYPATLHEQIGKEFDKQNLQVIDLLPLLSGKKRESLMVNRFDSHPNEVVHALAAGLLYDKIVPLIKVNK